MIHKRTKRLVALIAAFSIFISSSLLAWDYDGDSEYTPPRPNAKQTTCAGIRGNGQNLFAHYGALARHVEEYGAIQCAAGGSSGSITTFLIESMWLNPDMHNCRRGRCGKRARDARINQLIGGIQSENILDLLQSDLPQEGVDALVRLLRDLGPLINQELIELLLTSPNPVFHATDIIDGLEKGLQFIVDDPKVFLRTSVIDFSEFAGLFGVYGSFYAAYGPADRGNFSAWLQACAKASRGLNWQETEVLPGANGKTCGENFSDLFNNYREAFATEGGPNRVDEPVGQYIPAFGVTGVLKGEAIAQWEAARAAWIAADPIPFEVNFSDVGVGYWGQERELKRMERRLNRRYSDLNSRQFTPLGSATWREVLSSSPAEPGFSPAVPLVSGFVSVGGWADPLRVLPLEALRAKRTIAINRLDGVGGFTEAVTRLLNAGDDGVDALYSTTNPNSSFYLGLERATGVWCTDWDSQMGDPNMLFNDAFTSPLITSDRRFLRPRFGYENVGSNFSIGGCTPGVPVGN